MAGSPGLPGGAASREPRSLSHLDADVLSLCSVHLSTRDVAATAMTCRALRAAASSDTVWTQLFNNRWPGERLLDGAVGAREQYIQRNAAIQQMKFCDPSLMIHAVDAPLPVAGHVMLDHNWVWFAQGSIARQEPLCSKWRLPGNSYIMRAHNSRITCMRLFPVVDAELHLKEAQIDDNVLVTASTDRTIRLWWKGSSNRCFKGHAGPVTTLGDRLLGVGDLKVLASGGEDCLVRLWSVNSNGKQPSLISTLHGHQKSLVFLSVARYKETLLVSISRDSKIRVWDTTVPPSKGMGQNCIGNASVLGNPVAMKCSDALCYIASGSQVAAIDLRTMQKAFVASVGNAKIHSFDMLPSRSLICAGLEEKALLWDIRKLQDLPTPVAELESDTPVTLLHLDQYKIVTAGPHSCQVSIWETGTGKLANLLNCRTHGTNHGDEGVAAIAVDGCRIATVCGTKDGGSFCLRDFSNSSAPACSQDWGSTSKFWEPSSDAPALLR